MIHLRRGVTRILDAVFPRRCFVCDKILETWEVEDGIHEECKKHILFVGKETCMHCGGRVYSQQEYCRNCLKPGILQKDYYTQGKSVYVYKGPIKEAIYRFKYSNKREYAMAFAKDAVAERGAWIKETGIDMIIPVPMHGKKKRVRGYNQAEVFARELSRRLKEEQGVFIPVLDRIIIRKRDTVPMKLLSKEDRYINLKNAFQTRANMIEYGKIALVVDDIYTTGATVNAVAECLLQSGLEKVYFLSICIGKGI